MWVSGLKGLKGTQCSELGDIVNGFPFVSRFKRYRRTRAKGLNSQTLSHFSWYEACLGVLLLPPGWYASPSQGNPPAVSHQYPFIHLDPVARRLISVNPRLNVCSKVFPKNIFPILFRAFSHQVVDKKTKLNFPFKLSNLNLNFALTQGYLNPALNNPTLGKER